MDIIDQYFIEFEKQTGIHVQRGYQKESKDYPLLVYYPLKDTQFTNAYDKTVDYSKDQETRLYQRTVQVQISLLSEDQDTLIQAIVMPYKDFVISNNFFVHASEKASIRTIGDFVQSNFLLQDQTPVYQINQDLQFSLIHTYTKDVEYIDMNLTLNKLDITIKGGKYGNNQ